MSIDDLKAEHAKANKAAEDHFKLHLQWLGVAQWLAGKLSEEAAKAKEPKPESTTP